MLHPYVEQFLSYCQIACFSDVSKRHRRISQRTLQNIFRTVADQTGIEKKLHAHLFRHTAATHLNKVAGIDVTQQRGGKSAVDC
jgi:site-specific recombinase XerD